MASPMNSKQLCPDAVTDLCRAARQAVEVLRETADAYLSWIQWYPDSDETPEWAAKLGHCRSLADDIERALSELG
jgi:hypothetical protein